MAEINDPLLISLQMEEAGAFDKLYKEFYNLLFQKAMTIVQDPFIAKEMVQLTIINFWEKKMYMGITKSLGSYLFISVTRQSVGYLRQQKVDKKRIAKYNYQVESSHDPDTIDAYIGHKESHQNECEVRRKFPIVYGALPPRQKVIIKDVYLGSKTYDEAACENGITKNSVKTHLKNGLKNLRAHFRSNLSPFQS